MVAMKAATENADTMIEQPVDGLQPGPARPDHRRVAGDHRRRGGAERVRNCRSMHSRMQIRRQSQCTQCRPIQPTRRQPNSSHADTARPQPRHETSAASPRSSARRSTPSSPRTTCRRSTTPSRSIAEHKGIKLEPDRRGAAAPRRRPRPLRGPGQHRRHGPRHGVRRHRRAGQACPSARPRWAACSTCSASRSTAAARSQAEDYWPIHRDSPAGDRPLDQDRDLRDGHQGDRPA